MWNFCVQFSIFAMVFICMTKYGEAFLHNMESAAWTEYKTKFDKTYATRAAEQTALYNFNYNMKLIQMHNVYYDNRQRTYKLAASPFTDMRLLDFNAMFPQTTQPTPSAGVVPPPSVLDPPTSYIPSEQGYTFSVQYQGTVCNSGWAYATAKAIEIMQATAVGDFLPAALSAQNLIDCAGRSTGCKSQVPQTGLDYLTVYNQQLHLESAYRNNNQQSEQGMCVPPVGGAAVQLSSYSTIANNADDVTKRYVGNGYPVVIEFNPTSFEFMHYSEGIFQQPATSRGSHFMNIIGYGTDPTSGLDYWLGHNSFGNNWGEGGLVRILRSTSKPITKSAVFPWQ